MVNKRITDKTENVHRRGDNTGKKQQQKYADNWVILHVLSESTHRNTYRR